MENYTPTPEEVRTGRGYAVCAYLYLLLLVPILGARNNRFAMYHANQGLLLLLCSAASYVLHRLPVIGFLAGPVNVVLFVFFILGIVNAASGRAAPLPIIGGITLLR